MMKVHKSQEERKKLIKNIFDHINSIPYYEIKNSVILVTYSDEHQHAFRKITGKERHSTDRMPYLYKLKDGTALVDPTLAFLKPEEATNFVTMHYLMRMTEHARFVFVFNAEDTSGMPFNVIKKTFTQFISMFALFGSEQEVKQLASSCSILITDAKPSYSVTTYSERIGGEGLDEQLLQPNYLPKQFESVRTLVREVLTRKQIMVSPSGQPQNLITQQFEAFVGRLSPFALKGRVDLRLTSAYPEYLGCEIYKLWLDTFKAIYEGLEEIVVGGRGSRVEKELQRSIGEYNRRGGQEKGEAREGSRAMRLLKVLNAQVQIIMQFVDMKIQDTLSVASNETVLTMFLDALYGSGFLTMEFVRKFLTSYFRIRQFLSKEGLDMDNPDADLFHRISFCDIIGNIDSFNIKMRALALALLAQLEEDLAAERCQLPWEETLELLNSLLHFRHVPQFTFFTDRISKKLLKSRAELAHRLIDCSRSPKERLRAELRFVRYCCDTRLVRDRLKTDALMSIALKVAEKEEKVGLALEILAALPEYEVHQHVRYLYEKVLQLNVEVLQYLPAPRRQQLLATHFNGYYTFLLRVGFTETARELAMECLRLADSEEDREFFKSALVQARNGGRDMHIQFLESSILEEKQVTVSEDFLNSLQSEIGKEGMI